ncbi:MAG TPA: DNA topology modulation protein FlaR [Casimicrobiaceae bacterium]|nr:DNA topology modulation protein FlaR [Casimicrobiaceae bacterium]
MKPRIHLIGGPGSGKSYAAGKLSARFGVPAYDLDELFWERPTVRAERAVRERELAAIVARDGWIIEGVYYGWLAPSFSAADIIIALTPSIAIRQWRVIMRYWRWKIGEMPPNKDPSWTGLWELLQWNRSHDAEHLAPALAAVAALGRTWVECKTFDDVAAATRYLEPRSPAAGRER